MRKASKPAAFLLACVILGAMLPVSASASVSAKGGETCTIGYEGYIDRNGGLWLWGDNSNASAGQDWHTVARVQTPARVMENVVAFSRNDQATIVLKNDGSVWTFGNDYMHGEDSGRGGIDYFIGHEPVKVMDGCVAVGISGGYNTFGALKADGSLYTWGNTLGGGCGIDINTPGADPGCFSYGEDGGDIIRPCKLLDNVKSFSMGFYNGFAVKNDGTVWYWGLDQWHEKYPNNWLPLLPPVQLTGLGDMRQYSVGQSWAGVVMNDDSYWFFGLDENDHVTKYRNKVRLLPQVAMVSGQYDNDVYVLKSDGNLFYGMRGKEWVMSDVQWVYQSESWENFALILKNDGTLYQRKNGTLSQIASDVALSGKPFSSITPKASSVGTFRDVTESDWFAGPVRWAVEKGITNGTSQTTFSPEQTCTVAQILTFLWRQQGEPAPTIANPYRDVPAGQYYTDAAIWAYEKGLAEGSTFGGDDPCTRMMVVTYLWKLAGSPKPIDEEGAYYSYPVRDISDWGDNEIVSWALYNKITQGVAQNPLADNITFGPDLVCTRGQIVTFLYRADSLI